MTDRSVLVASAQRTPIGAFQGVLAGVAAPQLGAAAARRALEAAGLSGQDVQEVIFGCVLSAGLGQAPARQAALAAGIPAEVPCTTINKMCGSGMKAVMMAADQIRTGDTDVALAGGLESMSNAPYLLLKARSGYRMGHGELLDHMFYDGLQSAWDGQAMGVFAENTAEKYAFTREAQDAFAAESVRRALRACESGDFEGELAPVTFRGRKGESTVARDETPFTCDLARIPELKPAFRKGGTVTAASSSSISDGASALVLVSAATAEARGLKPLARIAGYAGCAQAPEWFTTAPTGAIRRVLEKTGWRAADVDLFEINEAFATVTLATMHDLGLDHGRVNVLGGACALGHPIGATGARILTTLAHALRRRHLRRGVAALCIGGGEATAVALEAL